MSEDNGNGKQQGGRNAGSSEQQFAAYMRRMREQNGTQDVARDGVEDDEPHLLERVRDDFDANRVAGVSDEDDPELDYKLSVYRYEQQDEQAFGDVNFTRRGEMQQAEKRAGRSVGDYIALVAIVLIPALIGLTLVLVAQSNRAQQQADIRRNAETTPVIYYADRLQVVNLEPAPQPDGSVTVLVRVNNSGTDTVIAANLTVILRDQNGAPNGTGLAVLQNIAPGTLAETTVNIRPRAPFVGNPEYLITSLLPSRPPTATTAP